MEQWDIFFNSCVHEHSLALSLGDCILALCTDHMSDPRFCSFDQPLELSESLSMPRCLRIVIRTVIWSFWMSVHRGCLSWPWWGCGADQKWVLVCCGASHTCHSEPVRQLVWPIYLAAQGECVWLPGVLAFSASITRQGRRGLGKGVKPSSCIILGWLTCKRKFPKLVFLVMPRRSAWDPSDIWKLPSGSSELRHLKSS